MKEDVDIEAAQEVARTLFHNIKQFLCVGYLRIYEDDGSLCPLDEYDAQRQTVHQLVLFVLKKYNTHITMTFTPELLAFQRGIGPNATTHYKSPRAERGDFIVTVVETMSKLPYRAVDSCGNKMKLEE